MLTKLLFHKVLGLTIFLATRLEILFQQHPELNSWLSVVLLFQNIFLSAM